MHLFNLNNFFVKQVNHIVYNFTCRSNNIKIAKNKKRKANKLSGFRKLRIESIFIFI